MESEKYLEAKFCKFSYKEISEIISSFTGFVKPIEQIDKQEIFHTVLHDYGDEFLKVVEQV